MAYTISICRNETALKTAVLKLFSLCVKTSGSRFIKRWHFRQQVGLNMMFNNQINRSEGPGWRKQDKYTRTCFLWATQRKPSVERHDQTCFQRKHSCRHPKAKRKAGPQLLYFLPSTMGLLIASVLFVAAICNCVHRYVWLTWQLYDEPIVSSVPLCLCDRRLGLESLTHGFVTGFYELLPGDL